MKKLILHLVFILVYGSSFSQGTVIKYLSGTDKDNTGQWNFLLYRRKKQQ